MLEEIEIAGGQQLIGENETVVHTYLPNLEIFVGSDVCHAAQNGKPHANPFRHTVTMVQFVREETDVESGHSTTKLTYADYVLFPEDGLRHEIIDGEHYVTPSPSLRHQRISGKLFHLIQTYLDTHSIGEVFYAPLDALLGEFDVVVPDLLYVSN